MDDGQFYKEMIEFKGETISTLHAIKNDLSRIDEDRKEHSRRFWEKMDVIVQSIHDEKNERINDNNKLNTEMQVMKGKAGIIATIFAFMVTSLMMVAKWLLGGK